MKTVILASQSPRRKELLEKCGVHFVTEPADINEQIDPAKELTEEIKRLSYLKAKTVLDHHPDAIVIGSDTIVAVNGEPLGKPHDRNDAHRMLRELSGHTHQVITGLCILSAEKCCTDVSVSHVTFMELSDEEINGYIDSGEPMDKAGAYAIQGGAGKFIENIDGDYYAIMGLPINILYKQLKDIEEY